MWRKTGGIICLIIALILIAGEMPYLITGTDMIGGKIVVAKRGIKDAVFIVSSLIFLALSILAMGRNFTWLIIGLYSLLEALHLATFFATILIFFADAHSLLVTLAFIGLFLIIGIASIIMWARGRKKLSNQPTQPTAVGGG
jgi:hypothetical protein